MRLQCSRSCSSVRRRQC
uniref:Uncharacterized protein n=1 Tax=Anguilla anguilla TaxID=7936 RepID=A0A0E9RNZ0_ANGAN